MRPTEVLMQEHRVIEQVLDCLDAMVTRCDAGKPLDARMGRDAIDFFRNFADRCHHGKEEDQLFPLMQQHGFPGDAGPIAVMRSEHDQGRAHVGRMESAIDAAASGDPDAIETFVKNARAFGYLLREHIRKEDHCLFPMADGALGPEQQVLLQERFDAVSAQFDRATHERCLRIADELADRLGVARTRPTVTAD